MQPKAQEKNARGLDAHKRLEERIANLIEKNEHAYNEAIQDFRDRFSLNRSKLVDRND